ncbi:Dolichyl-phosphate-mannose--protein mannosyltransferase 1 [Penicillium atrosanguineum]|nr:Dolichyl-phosphate-mannose--protein mannosyltransferase 1 [Penicillium atrosanguineum]
MGQRSKDTLAVRPQSRSGKRSPSRSPRPNNRKPVPAKTSSYASDGVKDYDILNLPASDYKLLTLVTLIATAVRLFRIYQPTSVVFDEVHFGGFATKYIKGKFFMDVHPPLAKLLITLAGWLAGFDGEFDFKDIGKDYIEPGVPYVAMRMLPAIMGVLTVSMMFLTLKATGCRTSTAVMGAGVVIFDNALTTQSRLILLDSPLIFFTALTALSFNCFSNQQELGPSHAFKGPWWFWLVASGLSLGATLSVKWVGLFTMAWVGSLTVLQLWVLLGDSKTVTPRIWFKHFTSRVFCLIVIPVGFYMAMFAVHFMCLVNPGEGDGFMSSEFQATLNSKGMQDVAADVAFGSRVSLRHHNTQGGYLHSHNHMYPTGSKQQQVTLYPHKDDNNVFIMENQTQPLATSKMDLSSACTTRLPTVAFILTMSAPPVTEADWQFEISAYGYEGFPGDANDLFKVEIVKSMSDGAEAKKHLRTIQTKFKLVHVMTGCVLFSHKVKLPEWGWEQQEVTCAKGGTLPNSIWYVEDNNHPAMPADAEKVNYRNPGFLGKFWELQKVMWTTNAGLVESHAWDSRPPSWPTLLRGINFWGGDHRQVYLLGNPLIWWSSTLAIAIYVVFKGIALIRWQRSCNDYNHVSFKRFDYEVGTSVLGWAFHYFPFFLMARQLFMHHYLPALYFAILVFCQQVDFVTNRIKCLGLASKPAIGKLLMTVFLLLSIAVFTLYSPLVYGNPWTQGACEKVKLLSSWDFDCNTFHADLSQYVTSIDSPVAVPTTQPAAAPPVKQQQPNEPAQEQSEPAAVTEPKMSGSMARVEYRDQHGNILPEDLVASLRADGKVKFETRYESLASHENAQEVPIVDGKPVFPEPPAQAQAPPHPDVEGQNPETEDNTRSAEESKVPQAKPASEGNEATAVE